ncbi:MAG: DUF4325 domain-containing protein [Candidatus Peribacteraceae bacterium]|nr:DUF4325 domain-containing protein [Candidatus Peribacteraceae bacterium]
MPAKALIIAFAFRRKKIKSGELAAKFGVSRQYASRVLRELVAAGKLVKIGTTNATVYVLPGLGNTAEGRIEKRLSNKNLKEHEVFEDIASKATFMFSLSENLRSIFTYAFSEMLNNAIEHSGSKNIQIDVEKNDQTLAFHVNDFGVGVFRNIMRKRRLRSEVEAIQDLLKGKTTTQPKAHSGEGIFFTSKIADVFTLESHRHRLVIDNILEDIFLEELKPAKKGTKVTFRIAAASEKHLNDIFRKYQTDPTEYGFDKTEVQVKLYTMGTIHISRSQARRVLAGLEKFKSVILDFDHVPTVGQAFADEIFRVFKHRYPAIDIQPINMNEGVRFMVERVDKE